MAFVSGMEAAGAKKPTSKGLITVENQDNDPESLLNWTRSLIKLRKETPAFWADSSWEPVVVEGKPYPMIYKRSDGEHTYVIVLNPTSKTREVTIEHCCTAAAGKAVKAVLQSGKANYKSGRQTDSITMGPVSVYIGMIQ